MKFHESEGPLSSRNDNWSGDPILDRALLVSRTLESRYTTQPAINRKSDVSRNNRSAKHYVYRGPLTILFGGYQRTYSSRFGPDLETKTHLTLYRAKNYTKISVDPLARTLAPQGPVVPVPGALFRRNIK